MAKNQNTDKRTYEVRSPVEHDRERYDIGEPIELMQADADPLLACGAIAEPAKKADAKKADADK